MKILIADNRIQYISHLAKLCKEYDLECVSETDPEAVVARIKNKEFYDILIINVSFTQATIGNAHATITESKINGVKILEIAKHTYLENNFTPFIPILCVSAGIKELYRFEQKAGIIFDFIERPFKDTAIRLMIEKAVKFLTVNRSDST